MGGKKKAKSKKSSSNCEAPTQVDTSLLLLTIFAKIDQLCDDQRGWATTPIDHLELLQSLVQELKRIQSEIIQDDTLLEGKGNMSTKESWDSFWKWVDQYSCLKNVDGSSINSMRDTIEIGWMGEDYGNACTAKRDIGENEVIMSIPVELMLCCNMGYAAQHSPIPSLVSSDRILSSSTTMGLSLLVAHEKLMGDKSYFHSYLSLLPKSFDVPLYWRFDDLALLSQSAPDVFKKACNGWRMACKNYCYLASMVQSNKLDHIFEIPGLKAKPKANQTQNNIESSLSPVMLSFETLQWALSVTVTRQNEIPCPPQQDQSNGGGGGGGGSGVQPTSTLALIPLWDMCNHSSQHVTTQTFVHHGDTSPYKHGALECTTNTSFKQGDQVHIFYGERPNSEYFLYSGFVPNDNDVYNKHLNMLTWPLTSKQYQQQQQGKRQGTEMTTKESNLQMENNNLLKTRIMLCKKLNITTLKDENNNHYHIMISLSKKLINLLQSMNKERIQSDLWSLFLSTNPSTNNDENEKDDNEEHDSEYVKILLALLCSTCNLDDAKSWIRSLLTSESSSSKPSSNNTIETNNIKLTTLNLNQNNKDNDDDGNKDEKAEETEELKEMNQKKEILFNTCMNILLITYQNQYEIYQSSYSRIENKINLILTNDQKDKEIKLKKNLETPSSAAASSSQLVRSNDMSDRIRHLNIAKSLLKVDMDLFSFGVQSIKKLL